MELPDIVLPILAVIIILKPFFFKTSLKWHDYIEIFIGIAIMGFSVYSSITTSQTSNRIKSGITELLEKRRVDSLNNADFKKFLKDSFGIEKVGNEAKIVNRNTYIKNFTFNHIVTNNPSVDYSKNFGYKLSNSKDTLILFPQIGVWVKPFFAFDASLEEKSPNIFQSDGMSQKDSRLTPEETVINNIKYKTLTVHLSLVRDKRNPLILDISADKSQYIIFGDQSDPKKRYIYKNGSVSWVPNL